jgi:ribulose-5-phosphate 4-epimerase/fuculose-1-phosphate aldolase
MRGSGCAVLAGVGVIAAGDRLDQAVYRLSLAERIAYFRQEAHISHRLLGGAPVAELDQG